MTGKTTFTEAEYFRHCEHSNGFCTNPECHEITLGDTEPDAEDYYCEHCEQDTVMGFESALTCGEIDIAEEE